MGRIRPNKQPAKPKKLKDIQAEVKRGKAELQKDLKASAAAAKLQKEKEKDIVKLDEQIKDKKGELKSVSKDVSQVKVERKNEEIRVVSAQQSLKDLVKEGAASVSNAKGSIVTIEQNADQKKLLLGNQIRGIEEQKKVIAQEYQELEDDKQLLSNQIDSSKKLIAELGAVIAEMQKDEEELGESIDHKKKDISSVDKAIAEAIKERDSAIGEKGDLVQAVKDLEAKAELEREELKNLSKSKDKIERQKLSLTRRELSLADKADKITRFYKKAGVKIKL